MDTKRRTIPRSLVVGAVIAGVALGSYGVASAASGSGSTSTTAPAAAAPSTAAPSQAPAAPPGATAQNPWGQQRSDETLLTGDTAAKVKALAVDKVGSGATLVRVETDADGHAAYEAHMVKADGTPVTVYVDKSFSVVGVETR
jgi:pyruvate/2-oxoglutarate dehydrogenase complex dihydrolipoamide acyltransferase (E2) component